MVKTMNKKNLLILSIITFLFTIVLILSINILMYKTTVKNYQQEIDKLKEKVEHCTVLLEKNYDTIEKMNCIIEQAEEDNTNLRADIDSLKEQKALLKAENKELEQEIKSLKADIKELENQLKGYSFRCTPLEREMMYYIVNAEMGDYSDKGIEAVAYVIINRVMSKKFPNTITQVIYQKNQFSTLNIWKNRSKQPYDKVVRIVDKVLAMSPQEIREKSGGAVFFYEPSICGYKSEFENRTYLYTIDGCRFFV